MLESRSTGRHLNVLFVMPPCLPTPPHGYGGIEAIAAALLPELERAGARVTLTTPEGSTVMVSAKHELTEAIYPILSHQYNTVAPRVEAYLASVMKLVHSGDFDVIHDFSGMPAIINTLAAPLPFLAYPPLVHTIHGPIEPYLDLYQRLAAQHERLTITGISRSQLSQAPAGLQTATKIIYNGLRPSDYPVGSGGHRLLVLGRITHDKGQDRLVEHCARVGLELDVAGPVAEISRREEILSELTKGPASEAYGKDDFQLFARMLPLIDGQRIRFHGNVTGQLKHSLLGGALALVIPNRWHEPFGMVAIEAMASGTPVVAMATGAMPELIVHGVTGWLAESFEQLCDYLRPEMIARLDRQACRKHVVEHFSMQSLAQEWLALYERVATDSNAGLNRELDEVVSAHNAVPSSQLLRKR